MRGTETNKPLGKKAASKARVRAMTQKLGNTALSLLLALSMVPAPSIAYALEGDDPVDEPIVETAAPEQEQAPADEVVPTEEVTPVEDEQPTEDDAPAEDEQPSDETLAPEELAAGDEQVQAEQPAAEDQADKKDGNSVVKQLVEKVEKRKSSSREAAKSFQDEMTREKIEERLKNATAVLTVDKTGHTIKDNVLYAASQLKCSVRVEYNIWPDGINPGDLTEGDKEFLSQLTSGSSVGVSGIAETDRVGQLQYVPDTPSGGGSFAIKSEFTLATNGKTHNLSVWKYSIQFPALSIYKEISVTNPDFSTIVMSDDTPTIKAEVVKEKTLTAAAADKYAGSTISNNYDLSGGNAYVRVVASDNVAIKEAQAHIKWSDSEKPNTPIELKKQDDGTYVGYYELKPEDMYNAKGELLTGETVLSCKDSADQSAREADTVNASFTSETKLIQDALASVKISSVSPAEGVVGPVTREGKDVYSGNVNITFDDGLNSSVSIGASGAAGSGKSYVVSATAGANEEHDVSFTASFTTPHGVTKSKTIDKSVESKLYFYTDTTVPTITDVKLANPDKANKDANGVYHYGKDASDNEVIPTISMTVAQTSTLPGIADRLTATLHVDGEDDKVLTGSWTDMGSGSWTFTPSDDAIANTKDIAKPYTVTVSAKNMFDVTVNGNSATEQFVVDYDAPVIRATFSGPGTKFEDLSGTYKSIAGFFGKEGSAIDDEEHKSLKNIGAVTIVATDHNLDPDTLAIEAGAFTNGTPVAATDWKAPDADHDGYWIVIPYASDPEEYDGVTFFLGEGNAKSLNVSAKDRANNTGTYTYNDNSNTTLPDGAAGATDKVFTIDVTPVELQGATRDESEQFVTAHTDGKNINVYNATSTTATITVKDANFDAKNTHVYDSVGNKELAATWTEDTSNPGTWTTTVTVDGSGDKADHNKGLRTLHRLTINANDLLGNKTTKKDLSDNFGYIAFDAWNPVVTVDYNGAEVRNTKGSVDYFNKKVKATITVKDPYFQDDASVSMLTQTGSGVWVGSWTDEGDGTWTTTVDYDENAYGTTNLLEVITKDMVSSDHATTKTYSDTFGPSDAFVVDLTPAEITDVSFDLACVGDYEGKDYYVDSDTMTATITVKDNFFDDNSNGESVSIVTPQGDPLATWSESSWTEVSQGVWETTVTFDKTTVDKDQSFDIKVNDLAKNGEDKASYKDYSAAGSETFVLDNDSPTISVKFDKKPVNSTALNETDYYAAEPTATITVTDRNFDPDYSIITKKGALNFANWTQDGETWTATITFGENQVDVKDLTSTLKLLSVDKAYLAGKNNGNESAVKANHRDDWNYTSGKRGSQDPTGAKKFVVDKTAPLVTVKVAETIQNTIGGVDYYGTAVKGKLPVTITVKDNNFDVDLANSTVTPSELGSFKGGWKKTADNTYQIVVNYSENADAKKSTLKLNLVDLLYTSADKKSAVAEDHQTKYGYRQADVAGKIVNDFKGVGAGNATATGFVLDLTGPEIKSVKATVNYSGIYKEGNGGKGYIEPQLFYKNSNAGVAVVMTDNNQLNYAEISTPFSFAGQSKLTAINKQTITKSVALLQPDSAAKRNELDRTILVTVRDHANHIRTWSISPTGRVKLVSQSSPTNDPNTVVNDLVHASTHPERLVLDTTAPELSWSADVKSGDFTADTKNVTLNVVELNWDYLRNGDPGQVVITVTKYAPNAGRAQSTTTYPVSDFTGADPNWSKQITFAEDGHYVLNAEVTDPAGNTTKIAQFDEFTIDKTKPTIDSITWDNNDVQNGKYYKAARTATITVTEHNWDDSKASSFITSNGSISSWSHNGDTHTATVSFATDGDYNLSVQVTDKAGNVTEQRTEPEFTVDLQAPKIAISNVSNDTAYGDTVAPVLTFTDEKNFSDVFGENGYSFELKGAKHGVVELETVEEAIANGRVITWADILRDIEYDDIYTLTARVVDLAGNETTIVVDEEGNEYDGEQATFTFSVNRFGSTFRLIGNKALVEGLEAAREAKRDLYLPVGETVVVQEINVTGAPSQSCGVKVSHGLDTDDLKAINAAPKAEDEQTSTGFFLDRTKDSDGWSEYTYNVYGGNFTEDGKYSVVVRSTDEAGNLNDSTSFNDPESTSDEAAEVAVEFVLDTQDPIIDDVNFTEGKLHNGRKDEFKNLTFTVTDNVSVDSVQVTIDGEAVDSAVIEAGTDGDSYTVPIAPKTFTKRTLEIVATDIAGRNVKTSVGDFRDTTNLFELYWPAFLAAGAIASGGGYAYVSGKKRRENEDTPLV